MKKMKRNVLKSLVRSRFLIGSLLVLSILIVAASNCESASDWKPTQAIHILVNASAGSSPDRDARMIQKLFQEKKLVDVPVVVEPLPGGGGAICWTNLIKHPGDGHYIATYSPTLVTSGIDGKIKMHHTDFTQTAIIDMDYMTFVVNADSPIKTGKDLVDRLKADPSSVSIGFSSSRGNQNHMVSAMLMKSAGGDVNKLKVVVFDGSGKVMMSLLGGHIELAVGSIGTYYPQVEAGKLRVIGIAAPQRLEGAANIFPTWKEQGHDIVLAGFRGLMGPKGLSQAQVAYWDNVFSALVKLEEMKQYDRSNFQETYYLNSKGTAEFLTEQENLYKATLIDLGMIK